MNTNKIVFSLIIISALVMGGLLFIVSEKSRAIESDIRTVDNYVDNEREALRVLNAEWHYLNRPDRLEKVLVDRQNGFRAAKVQRIEKPSVAAEAIRLRQEMQALPRPSLKPVYVNKFSNPVSAQGTPSVESTKKFPNQALKASVLKKKAQDAKTQNFQSLLDGLEARDGQ